MRPTQEAMANFNATIHFKKDGQIVANIPDGITLSNEGPYTLTVKKNMCVEMEVVLETAVLKQGSSGQEVREVQRRLKLWGYYNGSIDGIYGTKQGEIYRKTMGKSHSKII